MKKIALSLFGLLFLFAFVACKKDKPAAETVTDIDGNVYKTVKIGTQTWMAENLKTTRFNDGTAIPNVTDNIAWQNAVTPAYCWYNNTKAGNEKNGILYNGYTAQNMKLAPIGWHVPTKAEWETLINYLIANGYNFDGTTTGNKIAKSLASTTNWEIGNNLGAVGNTIADNNKSGFSALPAGLRTDLFYQINTRTTFWFRDFTPIANAYRINYNNPDLLTVGVPEYYGYSVRCVKD
jgi:uncharacterized protein (TIGR02145 family)